MECWYFQVLAVFICDSQSRVFTVADRLHSGPALLLNCFVSRYADLLMTTNTVRHPGVRPIIIMIHILLSASSGEPEYCSEPFTVCLACNREKDFGTFLIQIFPFL